MASFTLGAALIALVIAPAALAADTIYWGNDDFAGSTDCTVCISFASVDGPGGGGNLTLTGVPANEVNGIAIDAAAGTIYWANTGSTGTGANTISFMDLDGCCGETLNTAGATVNGPIGVAIDPPAGKIYWANAGGNKISFANLDGSGGGDLNTNGATVNAPWGVAVDPSTGRIYWANHGANSISYANLDGSGGGNLDTTVGTVNSPDAVAVDPNPQRPTLTMVYWTNAGGTVAISGVSVSGSQGIDYTGTDTTGDDPWGLAIDDAGGRIYWPGNTGDVLSFLNINGSGTGNVITTGATVIGPVFPVLLYAPSGAGLPNITGAANVGSTLSCSQGTWAPDILGSFLYRAPQTFAYQWSRDGTDISGATSSTITAASPGAYRCQVTAANFAGSASQASDPFNVPTYQLNVFDGGSGKGTVTSVPAGISCPTSCSAAFGSGTAVTLTASAQAGSEFAGWSGACSGTGVCQLTMDADHDVSATFAPIPPPNTKTAPPNTKITKTKVDGGEAKATFKFKAIGNATSFQCELKRRHNKARFKGCRSSKTYRKLKPGVYTFEVRARGPGGADPTPAKKTFKIP